MKHYYSLLTLIPIILILGGCYVYRYTPVPKYSLSSVNTPDGLDITVDANTYYDSKVKIAAEMSPENIELMITNNTSSSIKVLWDEGAFIDESGISHRIIHTKIEYFDRERAQVPSIIPKGASIYDIVAPSDYAKYKTDSGSWVFQPMVSLGAPFNTLKAARANIREYYPLKLLIPIEIEGIVKEYTFTFEGAFGEIRTNQKMDLFASTLLALGVGGGLPLGIAFMGILLSR